jgi:hypothetical protein
MAAQLRKRKAAMAVESGREEYVQPHCPGGLRPVDEGGKLFLFVSWYFCLFRRGDAWSISLSPLPITSEVKGESGTTSGYPACSAITSPRPNG